MRSAHAAPTGLGGFSQVASTNIPLLTELGGFPGDRFYKDFAPTELALRM